MKLTIELSEDTRVTITRLGLMRISDEMIEEVNKAIQNGTPTIERTEDRDKQLIEQCEYMSFDFEMFGRPMKALALDTVKNIVKDLPTVYPKSDKPSGKWIENNEQPHVEKVYHCSNCGNKAWGEYEKTTYCPNCGAKMVEEQGENTDGKH